MTSWVVRFDRHACAQCHDSLHARPKASAWHPTRHVGAGWRPASRTAQPVQLILCHDRFHYGKLRHLILLWLRIFTLQGMLTAQALPEFDRHDGIHVLNGHQHPGLALMSRLSSTLPSTRHTARTLLHGLWGVTRRRPRGVA